jgi:hypothetical protein
MKSAPKLLADWVEPCQDCKATGNYPSDVLTDNGCCSYCSGWGFVLNQEDKEAFRFLYGLVRDELLGDDFVRDPTSRY